MKTAFLCFFFLILAAFGQWPLPARAWQPRLLEESFLNGANPVPVIGKNLPYLIGKEDTLIELARRSGTGFLLLVRANPAVDPWLPPAGVEILLPYSFILPESAKEGITVNLAEQRLYHIWTENGRQRIRVYAVGIGRDDWETPPGKYTVNSRVPKPSWRPPPEIRAENPSLPAVVPAGPQNPLGDHWLGLSGGYGIHGTSKPYGVGRKVSHGCLRLYPEDIKDLFQRVKVGTPVWIIDQPIKVGLKDGRLYLEAHPPAFPTNVDPVEEVLRQAVKLPWEGRLDMSAVNKVLQEKNGIPTPVSQPLESRDEGKKQ
jgi:L,D-transpeptidase ErfK/SrfK